MPDWQKISESTNLSDVPNLPEMVVGRKYKMVIDLASGTYDWVFDALISGMSTVLWPLPYQTAVSREGNSIVVIVVGK